MEGILGNIRGVVHTHIAGRGKVLVVVDDSVLLGGVNCRNAAGLPMGPRRQTGRANFAPLACEALTSSRPTGTR